MKLRKKMMSTLSMVSATSLTSAQIVAIKNENSATIQPRQDKIDWVYKSENGRVYRRLFNFSKNEWVGDWILC